MNIEININKQSKNHIYSFNISNVHKKIHIVLERIIIAVCITLEKKTT